MPQSKSTFHSAYAEPDLRRNIFGVLPEAWPPETLGPPVVLLFRIPCPFFFFSRASRNFAFASSLEDSVIFYAPRFGTDLRSAWTSD